MRLDESQQGVIDAACVLHDTSLDARDPADMVINVQAVAGAGKSVIVTELTRRLSTARFLFLCKSENIADRARATLPPSVTIETFETAARDFVATTHPHKVSRERPLPGNVSDAVIRRETDMQATPRDIPIIRRALSLFCASSSRSVDVPHVEDALAMLGYDTNGAEGRARMSGILPLVRRVWASQTRRTEGSAPICRQTALKLWTLGRNTVTTERPASAGSPQSTSISPLGDADVLVVEEAQDLNEAQIGFIARQNRVTLMFGDDMQSLDANAPYRRQEHSLQQRGHNVTLARSYRFGGGVPAMLTALREKEAGEAVAPASGSPTHSTQIVTYTPEALNAWAEAGSPVTVIAPSVIELVTQTLLMPEATVGWVDGIMAPHYHWQTLFDLACLAEPVNSPARQQIRNPHFRQHPDIETAYRHLEQRGARHTASLCDWVITNRHVGLADHLRRLRLRDTRYQHLLVEQAEQVPAPTLTLATVRAAKGHEWPTVAVVDALAPPALTEQWHAASEQTQRQIRWLYTAISRAQHTVLVPDRWLAHLQEQGRAPDILVHGDAIMAMPGSSDHPHFGLSRFRVLEMSSEARMARRRRFAQRQREGQRASASATSGQSAIRARMEAGAEATRGKSASEHLSSLKSLTAMIRSTT